MNKINVCLSLFLALNSSLVYADKDGSIGIGLGHLYNGIGVNALRVDESNAKYAAIGCLGITVEESSSTSSSSSTDGESYTSSTSADANCGVSVGLISTNLINNSSGKHGLGIFAGLSYNTTDYPKDQIDLNTGISYTYFLNGLTTKGINLGFGILTRFPTADWTFNGIDSRTHFGLNFGFQF